MAVTCVIHFNRRTYTGRFASARAVRNQAAARARRRRRLHADPPPPWHARILQLLYPNRPSAARVRAAAIDHRVGRNAPRLLTAAGLSWWRRTWQRLSTWWWQGW